MTLTRGLWCLTLLLAASAAPASSGCAYLEARARDFQDFFRLSASVAPGIYANAARALARIGRKAREAIPALERAAADGMSEHIREAANQALAKTREEKR